MESREAIKIVEVLTAMKVIDREETNNPKKKEELNEEIKALNIVLKHANRDLFC